MSWLEEKDYLNSLMSLYGEEVAYVRHQEGMRAQTTNYILVASVALFGLMAGQKIFGTEWEPFGKLTIMVLIIVLNLYGMALSLKFYERSHTHSAVAYNYLKKAAELLSNADFESPVVLSSEAYVRMISAHPIASRYIRLHLMWMGFQLILAAMAVAVYVLTKLGH